MKRTNITIFFSLILCVAFSAHAQGKFPASNWRKSPARISGSEGFRELKHKGNDLPRGIHSAPIQPGFTSKGLSPLVLEDSWDSVFHDGGYYASLDNGYIFAAVSDSDNLYLAGSFQYFDNTECYNVVQYNKKTDVWTALGYGFNNSVKTLGLHNGKLYAGGNFSQAGFRRTTLMAGVAVWDGTAWKQLGNGVDGDVYSIAFMDSSVIIGGSFTKAGKVAVSNIARWDGHTWSDMGGGLNGDVNCLLVQNDSLYVGGNFYNSAKKLRSVALYTDGLWENLSEGFGGHVDALAYYNGKLWAGGNIFWNYQDPINILASWDGTQWSSFGTATGYGNSIVYSLYPYKGSLYIGGGFSSMFGIKAHGILKLTGETLTSIGSGVYGRVYAMNAFDTTLCVGGNFTSAGGNSVRHIATLSSGGKWNTLHVLFDEAIGGYTETQINAIATTDRYIIIGGEFTTIAGVPMNNIAIYDKTTKQWAALGKGVDRDVLSITVRGSMVYVGGGFTAAGDSNVNFIASYDLDTKKWSPMGDGSNKYIGSIVADETGVYAGVFFEQVNGFFDNYIGRWNGTTWEKFDGSVNGFIYAMKKTGDTIYIGGDITDIDGNQVNNIAMYTKSDGWSALGDGTNDAVLSLAHAPGTLYAGGYFTEVGGNPITGVARWNGNEWSDLDGGLDNFARAIAWDGKALYVGGYFTKAGSESVSCLAKWSPTSGWSDVGNGGATHTVRALAVDNKSLYAGGTFSDVGNGFPSYRFAILHFGSAGVASEQKKDMMHNYPNPFSSQTIIEYSLEKDALVTIELYNELGEKVRSLLTKNEMAGAHTITLDASDLATGMYYCRYRSGAMTQMKTIQVLK